MLIGLHHPAVSVPDMDAALDFYVGLLGLSVVSDEEWTVDLRIDRVLGVTASAARLVVLRSPTSYLELFEFHSPEPRPQTEPHRPQDHGLAHLCFESTDVVADHQHLRSLGMTFNSEPVDTGDGVAVYGRDPFGNIVELLEPRSAPCPTLRDLSPAAG